MAQVTVYANAGIQVDVVAGSPPVDQTALVAQLTADNATLTAANAALQAKINAAKAAAQADKDADAANAAGQGVLDALA